MATQATIANEWEQLKREQQTVIADLTDRAKSIGIDLSGYEIHAVDVDHEERFYMLTYRLSATRFHIDGNIDRITTCFEIAAMNGNTEITSNWFPASIENIDGVPRLICDRHDGRTVFDIAIA